MKTTLLEIRQAVRTAILAEIDIEDVGDVCFAAGSTHVMKTCSIGGDKYFLKFSDASLFDEGDPSLQILVEYLAYKIYSLYKGVTIPKVDLVYDRDGQKVGLASSAVKGKMAGDIRMDPKKLGKMLSAGVYVDIFLANWDVVGTGSGNVMVGNKDVATRIDPGGSLTYRAQGGRKGQKFGEKPGELKTMLDPSFGGSGNVFQYSDLKKAGMVFSSVPFGAVEHAIMETDEQVSDELRSHDMKKLLSAWKADVKLIAGVLRKRHTEVMAHVKYVIDDQKHR